MPVNGAPNFPYHIGDTVIFRRDRSTFVYIRNDLNWQLEINPSQVEAREEAIGGIAKITAVFPRPTDWEGITAQEYPILLQLVDGTRVQSYTSEIALVNSAFTVPSFRETNPADLDEFAAFLTPKK